MVRHVGQLLEQRPQRERSHRELRRRTLPPRRRYLGQGLILRRAHRKTRTTILHGKQAFPDVDRYEGSPPAGQPSPPPRERLPCHLAATSAFLRREGCLRQARLDKRQPPTEPGAEEIHARAPPQTPAIHAGR